MQTKLTLSVNDEKVKKVKRFSEKTGRSVSKLFEDFVDTLEENKKKKNFDINKIVGAFGKEPKNFDADKIKWEYLKKKHGL
jgi:hypothetical protein